jgi:hypothetical protein
MTRECNGGTTDCPPNADVIHLGEESTLELPLRQPSNLSRKSWRKMEGEN